jgi:hypothetical protein
MRSSSRSWNGGEVTPEFFGRIDDPKFQTGLALCRNWIVLPHGPVHNNAGTEFVREVKTSAKRTRVIPFIFSNTQTATIEIGEGYFRFHTMGATLIDGVAPYEVAHPYLESELFDIRFVQSNDIITLTHPAHPQRELRRLGALNWQLADINFGTTTPPRSPPRARRPPTRASTTTWSQPSSASRRATSRSTTPARTTSTRRVPSTRSPGSPQLGLNTTTSTAARRGSSPSSGRPTT